MARVLTLLAIVFLGILLSFPAHAELSPDTLSIGGGGYNFNKEPDNRKSYDYRLEYRWGLSLLPEIADSFNGVDSFFQVHPALGFEGNTRGAVYPNGGFNLDIPFLYYGIFTWGETVGAFGPGRDRRPLGSVLQFRSQFELGFRLYDGLRVTGFISHISNAHIVHEDPGAEVVGVYVHVPLSGWGKK